jgi:hypothetical protein
MSFQRVVEFVKWAFGKRVSMFARYNTGLEIRHERGSTMDYDLARMELKNGQLELISRLKNTLF